MCICYKGYFGRICEKKVYKVSEDTLKQTENLSQFEAIYFEDFINSGEKEIQFEINAKYSPPALLISNQNKEEDFSMMFREDRGKKSSVLMIESWDNGRKSSSLVSDDNWIGVTLMNLSPYKVEFTLKMSRARSNLYNVISLILYIMMVVAISLLLILSICVACLRSKHT